MHPHVPFDLTPYLASLAPASRVLDLGSGTGRRAEALRSAGFRVCALDLDVDALSTARSLYPGLAACAGRAEAPPFAAAVFDGVVCIDVLHWCADATAFEAAWKGAWEVLRPGGVFFARLRTREFAPESEGWFLADRRLLEELAARVGGEWLPTLTRDGDSVIFLLRKP
ncbi:MAG: methyltransferase type 11 [Fibrobacteria bacterium]|jgi:SAM-dependent methyltransferase|nr:methyltransferase type 11 [Fibrobacteria bacterium]